MSKDYATTDEKTRNVSTTIDKNSAPLPPPPQDNSGEPPKLIGALDAALREHLLMEDADALHVLLGAAAAFRLNLDLVWLMIVGPSSGAKTALLNLLDKTPEFRPLSDLTEKTLISGWATEDKESSKDHSLLPELDGKILAFKDFTTVLSLKSDRRGEILSQLREVYDGSFAKAWGTGKRLNWKGRIGLIAGVTEAIDREYNAMAQLGPRFVLFRMEQPDRLGVALRAMENSQDDSDDTPAVLAVRVADFLARLPPQAPKANRAQMKQLAHATDLVTRARSSVIREGSSRLAEHTPTPEVPGRFSKQILALTRGIAAVRGHLAVTDDDIATGCRVALDAIPPPRRILLDILAESDESLTQTQVAQRLMSTSPSVVTRSLGDLVALGAVERSGFQLSLSERFRHVLRIAKRPSLGSNEGGQECVA